MKKKFYLQRIYTFIENHLKANQCLTKWDFDDVDTFVETMRQVSTVQNKISLRREKHVDIKNL